MKWIAFTCESFVVGNIIALHGKETSAGEFFVEDALEAGLPQQIEQPIQLGIKYLTSLCLVVYDIMQWYMLVFSKYCMHTGKSFFFRSLIGTSGAII